MLTALVLVLAYFAYLWISSGPLTGDDLGVFALLSWMVLALSLPPLVVVTSVSVLAAHEVARGTALWSAVAALVGALYGYSVAARLGASDGVLFAATGSPIAAAAIFILWMRVRPLRAD